MKAFTFIALLAVCTSSISAVKLKKCRTIQTSMRQATTFTSFEGFNRRAARRARRSRRASSAECPRTPFRSLTGRCNNVQNPTWGAAETAFLVQSPQSNRDTEPLPNPRTISNIVCAQSQTIPNRRGMSELVTFFGQFIDHTVTEVAVDRTRPLPIPIPRPDPVFTRSPTIPLLRSVLATDGGRTAPENFLSSYIDGAGIYGVEESIAARLRLGTDGLLATSAGNLLPRDANGFFLAGDGRVNENPNLTAMHTLFLREHNRVAAEVKAAFPRANDEKLFQRTRKIVIAELQAIVYYEFYPAVTGKTLPPYFPRGYRRNVRASVSNEFSTVAFRVGHTLLNTQLTRINARGRVRMRELRRSFFNPRQFERDGVDDIFRGLTRVPAAEVDAGVTDAVRNFLVDETGRNRRLHLDLVALNIQRGRDHRVASYNDLRAALGLRRRTSIAQITSNRQLQARLEMAYGDVDKVDAWVGGIAEDQRVGSLGQLFGRIWRREFERLRRGDRFYFENAQFSRREISSIPTVRALVGDRSRIGRTMQFILLENTGLQGVKENPFFV